LGERAGDRGLNAFQVASSGENSISKFFQFFSAQDLALSISVFA
jgi:hypothetical protein